MVYRIPSVTSLAANGDAAARRAREGKASLITWPGNRIELLYVVARYNIQHMPIDT